MSDVQLPPQTAPSRSGFGVLVRLLVLLPLVAVAVWIGYLVIALGPDLGDLDLQALVRGYQRILQPAEIRGAPLRSGRGGGDRLYALTAQQERIVPVRPPFGRATTPMRQREFLHVDMWAFDVATARPVWRRRIRTFEGDRRAMDFDLLGADGETLWLFVHEPIGVAMRDGAVIADGAGLEAKTPALAGKRVDQTGFVAFGAQGLQLTLSDSTQWAIDGETLTAQPRASAPRRDDRLAVPAYAASYTSTFQLRGVPLGSRWLGVLTDVEADTLQKPPVVPGAKPDERRGVMFDFLEAQHVPQDLTAQPTAYRLWSARITKVSAAPRDWPKEFPDKWGTRDRFSDYQALPEAPTFLQAGLLGDGRAPHPMSYRDPDSFLVLHHDKVGDAGRLRLARVAGPGGRVVWDAALSMASLRNSTYGDPHVVLVGAVPNASYVPERATSRAEHEVVAAIDVRSGAVSTFDLTAESVADSVPASPR